MIFVTRVWYGVRGNVTLLFRIKIKALHYVVILKLK